MQTAAPTLWCLHRSLRVGLGAVVAMVAVGCASLSLDERPAGAMELLGVVVSGDAPPERRPDEMQQLMSGYVGAAMGVALQNAMEPKAMTVRVSDRLSLTLPSRQLLPTGTCVLLAVQPVYRDLLANASGVMGMPVGSTWVQPRPCP